MKTGRVLSAPDARDLKLAHYLTTPAEQWAPPARDWRKVGGRADGMPIKFSMFGNDSVGDCTVASLLHAEQASSVQNGLQSDASTSLAFDGYEAISPSGWKRTAPHENDDGAQIRDSLKWGRAKGIVHSFVSVDETNVAELKVANNLGMLILGWNLPKAWQGKRVWDVSPTGDTGGDWKRRTWGGHATASPKADRDHGGVISWAEEYEYTWPALLTYCDEARLVLPTKWVKKALAGEALVPNGFDLERLLTDVARLA